MLKQGQRFVLGKRVSHADIGCFPAPFEFLKTQFVDDELHPGLVSIFSIAEGIEDFNHGFDTGNQFLHRCELTEQLGNPWSRTQAHHLPPFENRRLRQLV